MKHGSTFDEDQIVLLDPATDVPIGTMEKLAAHGEGRYHAAVSVVLIDAEGRHILQQRSATKYHAPGLWSNACCTHPFPGESDAAAAIRRLREELGINCRPRHFGTIRYRASVPAPTGVNGKLIEYEKVELFGTLYSGLIRPHISEVSAVKSASMNSFNTVDIDLTPWFVLYMNIFGDLLDDILCNDKMYDFGYHDLIT